MKRIHTKVKKKKKKKGQTKYHTVFTTMAFIS